MTRKSMLVNLAKQADLHVFWCGGLYPASCDHQCKSSTAPVHIFRDLLGEVCAMMYGGCVGDVLASNREQ